jgi:hypothetical protein
MTCTTTATTTATTKTYTSPEKYRVRSALDLMSVVVGKTYTVAWRVHYFVE